jgi:hypothetical protein
VKVLFLDVDGVLNQHDFCQKAMCGPIHRDKVERLNRVLDATGAKVVLSSAWRYILFRKEATLRGLDWLLRSHGMLSDRLIGVTREDTMIAKETAGWDGKTKWPQENERGSQIIGWLNQTGGWNERYLDMPPSRYAVVDDLDIGISAAGHPFVQTDGKVGLTEADADRLIELLGSAHDPFPRRPTLDHLEPRDIADRRVEYGERA